MRALTSCTRWARWARTWCCGRARKPATPAWACSTTCPTARSTAGSRSACCCSRTPPSARCPRASSPGAGGRGGEGGMLRMIAYGSESNFAYPPRPDRPEGGVGTGVGGAGAREVAHDGDAGPGRTRGPRALAQPERNQREPARGATPAGPRKRKRRRRRPADSRIRPASSRACSAAESGGADLQSWKIFPGFMMFFGSSARLIVRIMSTAPAPVSVTRKSILCRPTPCSPVQVPSRLSARATSW